ncbi:MAG: DUF177 domain-containing protein [Flavobacteriales bacterium]|jgi:uncharacterized metal-binding protein YceD (DUF177 family)|nr:DUF177 domain-containing protein [Flavobacteriales bacterium]MBK9626823.1 DUF177 domain-containing protein [Flavobacteriales bacterium]
MEAIQDHTIAFTGLKDGEHTFHFVLEQPFFDASGEEEWEGGRVDVEVTLDKSTYLLVCNLHATGPVQLRCDRCNAPLEFPLDGKQRQIFSLTGGEVSDDDELVTLSDTAHSINLTHYIYECLRLALPIRHVHAPGQCDPEVEKVLERLIVDHEPTPDPRWEVLKELKNKESK